MIEILPMKRIVLYLLFLLSLSWGWEAAGKYISSADKGISVTDCGEAKQHIDRAIYALVEANSYADLTVQPVPVFGYNLARRYRPAGFSMDKWLTYLRIGQKQKIEKTFHNTFRISQVYTSQQREAGYYIYNLRKIII